MSIPNPRDCSRIGRKASRPLRTRPRFLHTHTVIWTYTRDQDQNLCSLSGFVEVGGGGDGPLLSACKIFTKYNTDGYWLVTGFDSGGLDWKRFASVQSCVIAVRRTDGRTDQVP